MKRIKIALVVVLGSGFLSLALAGDGMDRPAPPAFSDIDANDDGLISQEELQSFMESKRPEGGRKMRPGGGRFNPIERADSDGDGYLNAEEFNELQQKMKEMRGRRPDDGGRKPRKEEA